MVVKQLEVEPRGNLIIDQQTLREAHLSGNLRILVHKGEIRIVPETAPGSEKALADLDDLAGCLGQESAADYDFVLKIGGLHEAR